MRVPLSPSYPWTVWAAALQAGNWGQHIRWHQGCIPVRHPASWWGVPSGRPGLEPGKLPSVRSYFIATLGGTVSAFSLPFWWQLKNSMVKGPREGSVGVTPVPCVYEDAGTE